ncbi:MULTISPECIES: tol-pal system protein YbgF [Labrys]|uniref:Cell division coordinator CpoB n=1 Tax=Labrys neptuniae TaxID=376174 RepID=A0ABV3PSQ2_9HYPH
MLRPASAALLLAVTLALPSGPVRAASYDEGLMPPGSVGQDQSAQDNGYTPDQPYPQPPAQAAYPAQTEYDGNVTGSTAEPPPAATAAAPSPSQGGYVVAQESTMGDLLVRVQRLEGENRRLLGTVEDLQSQVRRLQDDMKRQQEDTEYRLQALEGGGGKASAPKPAPSTPSRQKSGQNAPPATQPNSLGSLPAGGGNDVAMQDSTGDVPDQAPPPSTPRPRNSTVSPGLPGIAVDTSRPMASNEPNAGAEPAPAAPATPEAEYAADYRLIETQRYDQAEAAFRNFIASHPKDKRVPDAVHWIGESLYQRKQYTDAAEQFLKVTKTYANSRRAPASMLKLGITLAAMGEKDAACAALQAVGSKYPKAGPTILSGADREIKKNACKVG